MNKQLIKLGVIITVLLIDYIWLNYAKSFYGDRIEKIQKEKMKIKNIGVLISYFMLSFGLYHIMTINSKPKNMGQAIERGAIYGFVTYSIFNATNMAIFNDWDESVSIVDTSWGTVLNGISGALYFMAGL
tara:strand:+ start:4640 stop:5029 length:390 start_codon:yes stop_codon:yes gene_type:complete